MKLSHTQILDESWSHPYNCNCDICLSGWALVGPDGGEPGSYGPFTTEQVNERQRDLGVSETD
jgi:hypothetical protein